MSKQITHYNIDLLDKQGAQISLCWGERSNGKSYQVKHKKAVNEYLFGGKSYHADYKTEEVIEENIKNGTRFMLIRRWKEEITTEKIEQYFADVDVMKLTDNKYNCISMYKKQLFLSIYDNETGKTKRVEKIGYVVALSTEQNYAGASYLDVHDMIMEEFMSRSMYLADEPNKLMNLYSTVDRKRGTTRLWLVGNSISRVCPYLNEWGIADIIKNQKQGEICSRWISTGTYDDDGNEIKVKIAIEYCKDSGSTSYVIGSHKDMLNKGSWQSDPQPHLPKSYNCYKMLYRIMFMYQSFKFIGEYLLDEEDKHTCWYVYPYEGEIKDKIIVFSDVIKTSPYWQRDIYNPSFKNQKLKDLLKTFKENQIFYATDLCGTDFKQVIDFEIKK